MPFDCRLENITYDSVRVKCKPGFDGGLPQTFVLEVKQAGEAFTKVRAFNETSTSRPEFLVTGLASSSHYFLDLYAVNAKGRSSDTVFLEAHTARQPPQPQLQNDVKYSFSAGSYVHNPLSSLEMMMIDMRLVGSAEQAGEKN